MNTIFEDNNTQVNLGKLISPDFQDNIVIEDDPKDINKRSKTPLDEETAELARESKLKLIEEDFNYISDKNSSVESSSVHPTSNSNPVFDKKSDVSNFKKPFTVPRVKRKLAEPGMMTSKECFYCVLELPDNISRALHYVRQHWEKVRQEQKHKGPKSKFHNVNNLQDDRTIFTPQFKVSKLANAAKAKEMEFAKKIQNQNKLTSSISTPNWLQKLDGNLKTSKTLPVRSDYSQALQAYQAKNAAVNQKLGQQRKTFEVPLKKPRFILPKPVAPLYPPTTLEEDQEYLRKQISGTNEGIGGDVLVNKGINIKGDIWKRICYEGNKRTTSRTIKNHLITNKLVSEPIIIED